MELLKKQLAWLRGSNAKKAGTQDVIGTASGVSLAGGVMKSDRIVGILGATDLYTVPTGKVAFVLSWFRNNPTGGSITTGIDIVTGLNSIRMNQSPGSIVAGAANSIPGTFGSFMEAGDILRVDDSAAGLIHIHSVVEAPANSNAFLKLARSFEMTTAAEKIYEAPAGKYGLVGSVPLSGSSLVTFFNNSGTGAKTCSLYLVPPGQAIAAEYLVGSASIADGGNAGVISSIPVIPPGYGLWVTSSANDAGVKCRGMIAEYDA